MGDIRTGLRYRTFTIRRKLRRSLDTINGFAPRGWLDAGLQFFLFFAAYNGYQVVRGITDGNDAVAFANAERVIDLEKGIGTFFEPGFQDTLLSQTWLIDFAPAYMNSHFVVTTTFLVWLYFFRNEHFYFVRNMFMVAMVVALACYAAFPTAPPRLIPEAGFTDTIAVFTGLPQDSETVAGQQVRGGAKHAHRLRADDRGARDDVDVEPPRPGLVVGLPAARLLRDRRHRQPLLVRCRRRRRGRLHRRRRRGAPARLAFARATGPGARARRRPPPSLAGCRPGRRSRFARGWLDIGGTGESRSAQAWRSYARNRLIESRLTPNTISMAGLAGNLAAAVLITQEFFFLGGIAFIGGR